MKAKTVPSFKDKNCVNCGICVQACPVSAIEMTRLAKNGKYKNMFPELTDYEGCIGCGLCAASCPMDCIEMAAFYREH